MGIAVGDAAQQVRNGANMVVARCEEHAVAEAIEAVLPGGRVPLDGGCGSCLVEDAGPPDQPGNRWRSGWSSGDVSSL